MRWLWIVLFSGWLLLGIEASAAQILPAQVHPDTLSVTALPWVQAGDSYRSAGNDMVIDDAGNVYVVGYFEQYLDLGEGQVWAGGEDLNAADIFVAKYDNLGNLVWLRTAGSDQDDKGLSIALANDRIYITGYFSGICYFDGKPLLTKDRQNMFVACYDLNGQVQWLKQAQSDGVLRGQAIAADPSGDIYVTGNFREFVTFDNFTVRKLMNQNIYLLKMNGNGDVLWLRQAAGGNSLITYAYVYNLICDHAGDVIMAGEMMGPVRFGNTTYTTRQEWFNDGPLPRREVFFAKYDSRGNLAWFRDVGLEVHTGDIAVDAENNIVMTGYYLGALEGAQKGRGKLGTESIDTHMDLFGDNTEDVYVVKYDSKGNLLWVNHFGGIAQDRGQGIAADGDGNIYVTGFFTGQMECGTFAVESKKFRVDAKDIFLVKFSPAGDIEWIETAGSAKADEGRSAIADQQGNIYLSGYFEGNAVFGKNWVTSKRNHTFYIAKYHSTKLF